MLNILQGTCAGTAALNTRRKLGNKVTSSWRKELGLPNDTHRLQTLGGVESKEKICR